MNGCSPTELLACVTARLMRGSTSVFIGTGLPMLAAALAKRLYAPDLLPVFEFGGVGSTLDELPLGVGESRTFRQAFAALGICDVMESAQRGLVHEGFLGGAQVDARGNLNTTVIGPYERPTARLPGSGGGNDVGSLCWRTFILMRHERKRFVEKLDFLTTPGYLTGPGARERAGLPAGTGPHRVVTDLGVFDFETRDRRMRLVALQPGASVERVREQTGFKFSLAPRVQRIPRPTAVELDTLREDVDRNRVFLEPETR